MGEAIKLNEFDIIGIITLRDVKGIEEYVTHKENGDYLSRSKEYYNVKSMTELSNERETLKNLLTREKTKRNFVILENMLNCSAKVFFREFEQTILRPENTEKKEECEQARQCLLEDSKNMIAMFEPSGLINVSRSLALPKGEENSLRRAIEMDNKAMLYMFCKSLKLNTKPEDTIVLTPGYGSVYIGPFLQAIYGYDFANMLKSKYIQETTGVPSEKSIRELVSSQGIFDDKSKLVILDDNVGTGITISEITQMLSKEGKKPTAVGAVQYNWRNYYRVSTGQKTDIERFNIDEFDILTPINYAGHKLYKHAIDMLLSSAEEYKRYLNSKSYGKEEISDIQGAILRGIKYAARANVRLLDGYETQDETEQLPIIEKYQHDNRKIRPNATEIIKAVINNMMTNNQLEEKEQKVGEDK